MIQNPKPRIILFICSVLAGALLMGGQARAGIWSYRKAVDPVAGDGAFPDQGGLPSWWTLTRVDPNGMPVNPDPQVDFDPTIGRFRESYTQGGVEMHPPLISDLDQYSSLLSTRTYRKLWRDGSRQSRSVTRGTKKKPGLSYDLPFKLPKVARSILGDGAPNIDVSGSETITLSANSDWTVRSQNAAQFETARQSAFPSLEMKQDLQVNLTGSIGDKIKVDVDQSSNVQTSLDNKVKLRYEGDEDDMIKSIDLGNTNLSLSGASIRQEGLFGVKTVAKLGNVDVVTIASKQEGKSETARFTPTGEKRQVKIPDLNYIPRQYYLLSNHPMTWDPTSLRVYRDDKNPGNNKAGTSLPGLARLDPTLPADSTNPQFTGDFDALTVGTDYDLLPQTYQLSNGQYIPIIHMKYPLGLTDVLVVSYAETGPTAQNVGDVSSQANPALGKTADSILVKVIKPTIDIPKTVDGKYDPTDPWYPVILYELRNFYDLTARDIALETLTLRVRRRDSRQSVDPEAPGGTPLIQVLGLDQEGTTGVGSNPDGKVDNRYLNTVSGIVFFPDFHPFDPTRCDPRFPLCGDNPVRNTLAADSANPNVYFTKSPDPNTQSLYYIEAEFKSSQQGYFIGRFNILENSEQVKVNNNLQKRGSDYNIDYDTGQITFSRPPGPDDVISVDYSFAPGVSQVQRTLMGFSTSYSPSADMSVTSSLLYESRGAQELNPKLGEEPARSMVGDIASILTFRPSWMTGLANVLPGVHTNSPSTLNIQGNAAVSMPNPNTKGEAYIDDMEGNRESNTLGLGRLGWMWSSIPLNDVGNPVSPLLSDHARINWYNPRNIVKEKDLKPILTKEEGSDNDRTVLEMNILYPTDSVFTATTWTGLTQALSRTGQDLSRTRFVEIWVNDHRKADHPNTHARLHLDFGTVSEDAFWDRNALPNGKLDTEDKNRDTKLDRGDDITTPYEDTGLDGLRDVDEPGYDPNTNPDPDGDDYHYETGSTDYSGINNTEGNSIGDPNGRPETEDLNLDGALETDNDYYEATVDLSDTAYVAIDVARDYPGFTLKSDNGWRLFRIPLDSPAFRSVGRPNWQDIKHARLWVDGMTGPTNLQIGGVELVGSRWLATPLDTTQEQRGVVFDVKVRNNKDDSGINPATGRPFYESPFQVSNAVGSNATRREQSMALAYDRLDNGDSVFAFKAFSDAGNGTGFTQYRNIRFWVHGDPNVEVQNLRALARFGPDTVNYYEYSIPVRAGWQDVRIPMEVLSRLKERDTGLVKIDDSTGVDVGARYTVVGNPSFTRINRITFGVTAYNSSGTGPPGEVWFDELRVDDVRKDVGKTGNVTVQANFADVLAVSGNFQKQDQDFFRVGSGVNQGQGFNHTAVGFQSTLQLDKMLPLSGLELPVTIQASHVSDIPKYRTGSDVILDKARSDVETRLADQQEIRFNYSRTGPRKGWTRWTIDAITGNMRYQRASNIDPTFRDSSWTFSTSGNYNVPIGGGKGIGLGRTTRFKYLPDVVSFGADWSATRHSYYTRTVQGLQDSSVLRSDTPNRILTLHTSGSYLPINGVTLGYKLDSTRDMLLRQSGFTGGNVGTEVDRRQQMTLNWVPRRILFLNPNVSLSGRYHENAGPSVRVNVSDPSGLKNIDNGGTARVTTTIPLSRFAARFQNSSPHDTTGLDPVSKSLRFLLSRIQDIQTTFAFDRAAAISRVMGSPGLAYTTGFTQKFDPGLYRATSSNVSLNRSYITTVNTRVQPFGRFAIDVHADHKLLFSDAFTGARRSYALTWPDLNGSWLQLQQVLGMEELMSSLILTSHYSLRTEESGPEGKPIETRTKTTNWSPLLRWETSFKNGIRADATTSLVKTEVLSAIQGDATRTSTATNHEVHLTKIYPAAKGIRFPWSKRRVKLPNDVNLNLTMVLASTKQETEVPGFPVYLESQTQRLNVGSGTSYNFTPSITGGFDLSFEQNKDYKLDITRRGIHVAVNGQFRF